QEGCDSSGPAGRRDRPRRAVDADDGRRPWATERAPSGRPARRAEVDGDQASAGARPPDHAAERVAILGTRQITIEKVISIRMNTMHPTFVDTITTRTNSTFRVTERVGAVGTTRISR